MEGNDYIYINAINRHPSIADLKSVRLNEHTTRNRSDGLVLIDTSDKADFSMRIFNADGSKP